MTELRIPLFFLQFSKQRRSIIPAGDTSQFISSKEADIAILEEPEHLNWYHHGKRWTDKFNHVVGIVHTNYLEYIKREHNGPLKAFFVKHINTWVTRAYCNKVLTCSHFLVKYYFVFTLFYVIQFFYGFEWWLKYYYSLCSIKVLFDVKLENNWKTIDYYNKLGKGVSDLVRFLPSVLYFLWKIKFWGNWKSNRTSDNSLSLSPIL